MEANKPKPNPNPREKASIFSLLFWTWTFELFRTGYSKELGPEDLYDPIGSDQASIVGDRLEKCWDLELRRKKRTKGKPNLLLTIFRCFFWELFFFGILHFFNELIVSLAGPIILGMLLQYFRGAEDISFNEALLYAGGISLSTLLTAIGASQFMKTTFHIGTRIRSAVGSLIYRKALKLSITAFGDTAPGKIVNLIANDVSRFDLVVYFIHYMWSAPLSALLIAYYIYTRAGLSGIFGIVVIFVVVPLQSYTGKLSSKFRHQTAIRTDERVRLMDEIVSGVQVIKLYAWEKPFCAMVALARKMELKVVRKISCIRAILMTFNLFTTRLAIYCTLIGMMCFSQPITADKTFVFCSFFNTLSYTMTWMFVRGIAEFAECFVSIRRLQHFLMYDEVVHVNYSAMNGGPIPRDSEEIPDPAQDIPYIDDDIHNVNEETASLSATELMKSTSSLAANWAVKMSNATAKWEPETVENTLNKVNIKMEREKLYVIIGHVGSGKSSLISAILGELSLMGGNIEVNGSISYAAQESWVFGSTVKQNIIFGQPYNRQRYQKVVKVCALLSDLEQFPQGDQTIVGERGNSLSGGQKARINLARAVYRQADIYILDDPLSAVDTHVGKHLFEECLERYLSGKTRILVTHQLQYIKNVDGIILIEQGSTRLFANYIDLLSQCPEYGSLLASESSNTASSNDKEKLRRMSIMSAISSKSNTPFGSCGTLVDDNAEENAAQKNIEEFFPGVVKGSIFVEYLRSGGNWCFIFTIGVLFIITQVVASATDLFLPVLVNEEESRNKYSFAINSTSSSSNDFIKNYDIKPALPYIYIYTGLVSSIFIVGIIRSLSFYFLCTRSSQNLHDRSFGALIRTTMRFFDTNPSGRILNRFSKDIGAVDEMLPRAVLDAVQTNVAMIGSLVIICSVNRTFLGPLGLIACVFYLLRKVYLKTSVSIKRLEGILKSPIFTHLNATLNGLTTIRAYGAQDILRHEFDRHQDVHCSAWFLFISVGAAFGFYLDIFCAVFITIVTFSFLLIDYGITGAEIGLALSTVMAMTGVVQWGIRRGVEVNNQLMSAERILEYACLPPEDNAVEKKVKKKNKVTDIQLRPRLVHAPDSWPSKGCIKFQNVSMRYAEEEPQVLKALDLVIKSREKVGIVGRTGAGKSSLISALFRLAKVEGVIDIDGIDTGTIYLEELRQKISIIPQDPVLFSGTLRKNLDPFFEFSDSLLWAALEEVELKDAFSESNGLDSRVFDRGTNFSAGQRQLVCLARAILRNNKILVLDEATANVDPHTDSLIQRAIRNKFADCTVLTVAHRLNTIMDSDKVLVMSKGQMIEFDHPHILLNNENSQFSSLVRETGRAMSDQLTRIANEAYNKRPREI